jgi:hypothetical protein
MIAPTGFARPREVTFPAMDQTNRAIIVTGALLFIFAVLVIVMMAWGAADNSIDRMYRLSDYMAEHNNDQAKLIITFGGLILALGALIIIIYELTPEQSGELKVEVGSGDVRISTDEIASRLEEDIRAMPQVQNVQATVTGRGSRAEVKLALHVQPQADLAATGDEACRRARDLIESRMGVRLASEPHADLHYRELRVAGQEGAASQDMTGADLVDASQTNESPRWKPAGSASVVDQSTVKHEAETASERPPSGV